ncbi:hypothetical protein CPter291_0069 [Collimonas pratensis]|uniref:Uncharacterized protein n=1 Tax=Collimonas pratensis TaxID=279113 RepID=A0ABM5Z019_9BURK|nr:hypothetical protein CPter291_0069 [Collimonas pratensis]
MEQWTVAARHDQITPNAENAPAKKYGIRRCRIAFRIA